MNFLSVFSFAVAVTAQNGWLILDCPQTSELLYVDNVFSNGGDLFNHINTMYDYFTIPKTPLEGYVDWGYSADQGLEIQSTIKPNSRNLATGTNVGHLDYIVDKNGRNPNTDVTVTLHSFGSNDQVSYNGKTCTKAYYTDMQFTNL
ncbi:hypothetical protein HDV06_006783 [Boothiomyces sp. JEL0866]|nr:hypothetical protein HDV06_006783 [Boothiomyces sp. JEL0866]